MAGAATDDKLTAMYQAALALQARGQLRQADRLAQALLRTLVRSADDTRSERALIWQLRGELALRQARPGLARQRFVRSLTVLPRCLLDAEGVILRIRVLQGLANAELARGHYGAAEKTLERALRLAERRRALDPEDLAHLLNQLGMACKYSGRYRRAEHVYLRALRLLSTTDAASIHPLLPALYHNLGGLYFACERFADAEPPARRSVELRKAVWGADHPAVVLDEAALAAILTERGAIGEAERLYRSVLATLAATAALSGPEKRYELAVNYHNLAALLADRQPREARQLYRRALKLRERLLGKRHPEVGMTLHNLAVLCEKLGSRRHADPLHRRAAAIFRALPARHPLRLRVTRRVRHG